MKISNVLMYLRKVRNRYVLAVLSKKYCRNCGAEKMDNRRIRRKCPNCGDPEDKNFIDYLADFLIRP